MTEKLLTVRDVSLLLGVTEREVMDLAEAGVIPAYKIGGVYLRFKRDQIEDYRKKSTDNKTVSFQKYPMKDRVTDFIYYNDFYIFSAIIIALMLYIILGGA